MRLLFASIALAVACSRAPAPEPLKGPFVVLRLDGRALAAVPITHDVPLSALVPRVPAWIAVEASASDGRYLDLDDPAHTYPGAELRLGRDGERITIGLFNPPVTNVPPAVAALAAQPLVTLSDVTEVGVWTHARAQAQPAAALEIAIPGREAHTLTDDELDGLPERGPRPRIRGWALADVIDLAVHDIAWTRVQVIGEGSTETFSRTELAASGTAVLLKKNQRGLLVLQVWNGAFERPSVQVRGVTKLVIDPPI